MSQVDETKLALSESDETNFRAAQPAAAAELLEREPLLPNVRGVGIGVKWTGGAPTGEPALVVFLTHKVPEDTLAESDRVPGTLQDLPTDVLPVGELFAGGDVTTSAP